MGQFERDRLELGRRVACSLHYQHPRNLRLVQAAQAEHAVHPLSNGNADQPTPPDSWTSMGWMLFGFLTDRGVLGKIVRHRLNRDDGHQANAALSRSWWCDCATQPTEEIICCPSRYIACEVLAPKPPLMASGGLRWRRSPGRP